MTVQPTPSPSPLPSIAAAVAKPAESGGFQPFGEDGFDFFDILDVINPLQHLPVVSTLYREITGDQIAAVPRIAGGGLFGGPIGLVASLVNVVVDETTGKDLGEHVMALFEGDAADDAGTAVASAGAGNGTGADGEARRDLATDADRSWDAFVAPRGDVTLAAAGGYPPQGLMPARVDVDRLLPPVRTAAGAVPAGTADLSPESAVRVAQTAAALTEGERQADAFAALRARAARPVAAGGRTEPDSAPGTPPAMVATAGATADNGGWFSTTMLSALKRYEQSALLAEAPRPSVAN